MAKIALNKKTVFSFLLFSALFFFLPVNNTFSSEIGYDTSKLSEQAKNLNKTFNKDYGLSSQTKPAQSRRAVPVSDKQENETDKTSFFSLAPAYKKIFSSIINIPRQTASVFSSFLSPVGDFVSGIFINENVSEIDDIVPIKKSSSSRSSASSSSAKVALATSSPNSSPSATYNLPPKTYNLAQDITRREVETLIKQSDNRNLALIRSILTSPSFAKSSVVTTPALLSNSDSLSV